MTKIKVVPDDSPASIRQGLGGTADDPSDESQPSASVSSELASGKTHRSRSVSTPCPKKTHRSSSKTHGSKVKYRKKTVYPPSPAPKKAQPPPSQTSTQKRDPNRTKGTKKHPRVEATAADRRPVKLAPALTSPVHSQPVAPLAGQTGFGSLVYEQDPFYSAAQSHPGRSYVQKKLWEMQQARLQFDAQKAKTAAFVSSPSATDMSSVPGFMSQGSFAHPYISTNVTLPASLADLGHYSMSPSTLPYNPGFAGQQQQQTQGFSSLSPSSVGGWWPASNLLYPYGQTDQLGQSYLPAAYMPQTCYPQPVLPYPHHTNNSTPALFPGNTSQGSMSGWGNTGTGNGNTMNAVAPYLTQPPAHLSQSLQGPSADLANNPFSLPGLAHTGLPEPPNIAGTLDLADLATIPDRPDLPDLSDFFDSVDVTGLPPKSDLKHIPNINKGKGKRLAAFSEHGSDEESASKDVHVNKGKGRGVSVNLIGSGKERAASFPSSGEGSLPPARPDKGKNREVSASHPAGSESFAKHSIRSGTLKSPAQLDPSSAQKRHQATLSFADEVFAIGDVDLSDFAFEKQPVRYSVGESSGYNNGGASFVNRSPAYTGGNAFSAGYASSGYLATHPLDSNPVPRFDSGTGSMVANVTPSKVGRVPYAAARNSPLVTPPNKGGIPLFKPGYQMAVSVGSSASPIVISDASSHNENPSPATAGRQSVKISNSPSPNTFGPSQPASACPSLAYPARSRLVANNSVTYNTPPQSQGADTTASNSQGSNSLARSTSPLVVDGSASRHGSETSVGQTSAAGPVSDNRRISISSLLLTNSQPTPMRQLTALEIAVEIARSHALRTAPKRSSPLRYHIVTASKGKEQ